MGNSSSIHKRNSNVFYLMTSGESVSEVMAAGESFTDLR